MIVESLWFTVAWCMILLLRSKAIHINTIYYRYVWQCGEDLKVEVYPEEIKVCIYPHVNDVKRISFCNDITLGKQ